MTEFVTMSSDEKERRELRRIDLLSEFIQTLRKAEELVEKLDQDTPGQEPVPYEPYEVDVTGARKRAQQELGEILARRHLESPA